jgi:hypothetical protein
MISVTAATRQPTPPAPAACAGTASCMQRDPREKGSSCMHE